MTLMATTNLISDNSFDWSTWQSEKSVCSVCNEVTQKPTIIFDDKGSRTYCKRCIPRKHLIGVVDTAKNVFQDFTLQHVKDETGKNVTVHSLKELRAAEKRYNFALACATNDNGDVSQPPQHEPWAGDITHGYKKKFNLDPAAYTDPRNKSEAGIVGSVGDTLVDRPNGQGAIKGGKK